VGSTQLDLQGKRLLLPYPEGDHAFGNAGCKYDDVADVPLNPAERHNVSAIKKAEAKKGC
jgi:hypothetical protein